MSQEVIRRPLFIRGLPRTGTTFLYGLLAKSDAATEDLRERTSSPLHARLSPIAQSAMRAVGFYSIYRDLIARYRQIPFVKLPAVDLEDDVADRTQTALFGELAKQESRIRRDPAAQTSARLRRVFGAVAGSVS